MLGKIYVLEGEQNLDRAGEMKGKIQAKTNIMDHKKLSLFAIIIIMELVLGGSGRLITFGSFISLRYILFLIAILYFIFICIVGKFKIQKNMFYIDVIVFFVMFSVAVANGIVHGYGIGNVIKSSQGYLYLLMYFPMSILINTKEKSKQAFRLFINCAVILAIVSLAIFVFFYFDHTMHETFSPILTKFDYGYIALRGGLPAVFLKTSPLIAVAFVLLLLSFINLKSERTLIQLIKLLILFVGLVSTMSMGIWVATFAGVFLTILSSKGKYKVIGLVTIVIITSIAYYLLSGYIATSLTNRLSTDDSSYIIKLDQAYRLLESWGKRVFFGNGFGIKITFLTDLGSRTMINFELFWLQLLVNMGLIGFAVYIKIFIKSAYYTLKISKVICFKESMHLKSLIVGLIVLAIISSVNPFLNNPIGLGYLVIVMTTISTYSKELKYETINKEIVGGI